MKTTEERTFDKVDGLTFKITEKQTVSEEVNAVDQLNNLVQAVNKMKQLIVAANKAQDDFVKYVERYNERREILAKAKDECGLEIEVPVKIDLPKCFSIIEAKIDRLPEIKVGGKKVE